MTVYLDACCLSRLTDDQSQARIREEAESIHRVFLYLALATVEIDDEVAHRAQSLVGLGYGPFDALHIAAAESAGVDPVSWSKEQGL